MATLNLPADFETYAEARKAGFMRMKELKDNGARVIGVFCSFVPQELILAAGAVSVGLCASSEEPIRAAEADLPRNLCPLIKASYGFALTDTCPYFYFSDLVVGETTCDGKKKMFELMNDIKETYVLQLPSARDENALDAWEKEIIRFWKKLEDFYGITITEEDVRKAIELKNHERDVMLRFLELGKLDPAPLSGYEMGTRPAVPSSKSGPGRSSKTGRPTRRANPLTAPASSSPAVPTPASGRRSSRLWRSWGPTWWPSTAAAAPGRRSRRWTPPSPSPGPWRRSTSTSTAPS